jgi:hypothetical protein
MNRTEDAEAGRDTDFLSAGFLKDPETAAKLPRASGSRRYVSTRPGSRMPGIVIPAAVCG